MKIIFVGFKSLHNTAMHTSRYCDNVWSMQCKSKPQICFNAMLHDSPSAMARKIGCLGWGRGSGSGETAIQDCLISYLPKFRDCQDQELKELKDCTDLKLPEIYIGIWDNWYLSLGFLCVVYIGKCWDMCRYGVWVWEILCPTICVGSTGQLVGVGWICGRVNGRD